MPCSCTVADRYQVARTDGSTATYRTLPEAQADVARHSGQGSITKIA